MEAETVCHPSTEKTNECPPEASRCNKKMLKFMKFSLSMDDTELDALEEPSNLQPEQKQNGIEDDSFVDDDAFLSLAKMSLNLMVDQESDADNPLCKCDLISNESKIMADTADISYISTQIWKVIKQQNNLFLKTLQGCKYVASKQNEICLENTMSAKITVFYGIFLGKVTSNEQSGVPVVLNFTDTENFLCCSSQGEEQGDSQLGEEEKTIKLTIKAYDIKKIHLSADDPEKSSLIFYMSQKCDGLRYFESALHRGWFIHTVNDGVVKMQKGNNTSNSCFVLE